MFCTNCGTRIEEEVNFCSNCGNGLDGRGSQSTGPSSRIIDADRPLITQEEKRQNFSSRALSDKGVKVRTRRRPSFMLALCCMFIPPVYFIVRKRFVSAVVNGIIWLAAFPSLLILPLGVALWFIAAGWAMWNMGHDSTEYQAQKIGEAMRQ